MKKLTTEEFIKRSIAIHGNALGYANTQYVNAKTKIVTTCGIHGDFEQLPNGHLKSTGCPKCAKDKERSSTEEFIAKAKEIHGDKYDYSKVEYKTAHTKVVAICHEHGEILIGPNDHLKGFGCNQCGNEVTRNKTKKSQSVFITEASIVHNSRYDYSKVKYINNNTKVTVICPEHGEFTQSPIKHLKGQGCKICNCSHTYTDLPTILYYLRVTVGKVKTYKIGITSSSVTNRYEAKDLKNIEIIQEWRYNNGKDAYEIEQKILKDNKEYKYRGLPLLVSGNSELFTKDVLNLDDEKDEEWN